MIILFFNTFYFFQIYILHKSISGHKLPDLNQGASNGDLYKQVVNHTLMATTASSWLRNRENPSHINNLSQIQKLQVLLSKNTLGRHWQLMGSEVVLLQQKMLHAEGVMDTLRDLWPICTRALTTPRALQPTLEQVHLWVSAAVGMPT